MNPITIIAPHEGPLTRGANNTYLVGGPDAVLIDAGAGQREHLDALDRALAATGARLSEVIVTHAHADHAAGVEAIHARWPAARFSKFPWPERDSRYGVVWQQVEDRALIRPGRDQLLVVHTPGHAPDHIALWHESSRTLFSGDLVIQGTTVVIPGSHAGSVAMYLRSLERVIALNPSRLLPAHGPAIDDPLPLLRGYIAHRLDRERQILAAVRNGHRTVEAIVSAIYPGLDAELTFAAAESVLAHLLKLADDRLVARDGDLWRRVNGGTEERIKGSRNG